MLGAARNRVGPTDLPRLVRLCNRFAPGQESLQVSRVSHLQDAVLSPVAPSFSPAGGAFDVEEAEPLRYRTGSALWTGVAESGYLQ